MFKKYYINILLLLSVFIFSLSLSAQTQNKPSVKMWEEPLTIPTYLVESADLNPIFYTGRAYQGAQGKIYPYPFMDRLTDIRKDKTYNGLFLENDYIKICVLPELGGRLFSALDKTNNYDFFYRQHVIKPALIGMLGAWISGGIEWNVPHHHRASTFMPVDYILRDNPDGSKTIWVGEIELRHRMKWIVGLTLRPGKSYIEVTGKLFNRTPFAHSFLFWANIAVHADSTYQTIFPPGTEYATFHGKNQFSQWPLSYQFYNGTDYTDGVDVSMWKNHPRPTSLFAWNYEDDFLAGYDHGKDAGTALIANHHVIPGKKLWQWGPGPRGRMWDKILTETDGPYAELMVGAYSDNQPDYSWCQPYAVKTFKQYWYPIRKIKGVKYANEDAALNLEINSGNSAQIGLITTSDYKSAKVILKSADIIIYEENMSISPGEPYFREILIPGTIDKDKIELILQSYDNKKIISYKPVKKKGAPMPEPAKPPPPPEEIKTNEELYLTGLRLEQFYNPALEPLPYYEEAIKRDPGDSRVNTQLGIFYLKKGLFEKAEETLNRAVKRITKDYIRPKDGEAFYYLGAALKAQKKYNVAYDAFNKAAWCTAWFSSSHYQMTEIQCMKGNLSRASDHIEHSLSMNMLNTKALNLKATLLRKSGDYEEAEKYIMKVLSIDPVNFRARYELSLTKSALALQEEAKEVRNLFITLMRNEAQNYLELAVDYGNPGFWDESIDILTIITESGSKNVSDFPLLYYYLGYYRGKQGSDENALKYYTLGSEMPPDYCFPFRMESVDVLEHALKKNPGDARAHYYLGNLLFEEQPERAIREWEESIKYDDSFSIVYRNLGFAYARINNDITGAIKCLEKSIACKPDDPRLYYELDILYEMEGVSPEKRLALLEKNHKTVSKRDDALSREIMLCVQLEKYDKAIDLLKNHHFHVWEGGGRIHNVYVDAHLLRGKKRFTKKQFAEALKDYKAALEYPENLEVGRPHRGGRASQIYYFTGTTYEAMGDINKAKIYYEKSVEETHNWSEIKFYQGLSFRKLNKEEEAGKIFDGLIRFGEERLRISSEMDFFAKFGEKQSKELQRANAYYLSGLGYLGKGQKQNAEEAFKEALKLNINHIGAITHLSELN